MPSVLQDVAYWRDVLRRHDTSELRMVKQAELGGDGNDATFEQAFSNIAHAHLRAKAPTLMDHELGFQLLDRNQDNSKAVGVFGFKVGSHLIYAPVFFLQGELKGHELLYLKNQDLFVPMKENWVNYILNRKPRIIGESVDRNMGQLGVMQPDLNRLSQSPQKYASAMPQWLQGFMPKFGSLCLNRAFPEALNEYETHCRDRLDFGHFIKQASLPMLEVLVQHCQRYPQVGQRISEYHGLDTVRDAIKSAGLRARGAGSVLGDPPTPRRPLVITTGSLLKQADEQANQKVKVITYDTSQVDGLPEGSTEEDKEKLLRDAVLIKDDRGDDEVSVPYNIQVEKKLFNPDESGLYEILVKPGKFERCFVVVNPHGPDGRVGFATLIRIGDEPNWVNAHANSLWATSRIETEDYDKWYDGLKTADSLPTGDGRCVLVGPRNDATLPFTAEQSYGKEDGTTVYEVNFDTYCQVPSPSFLSSSDRDSYSSSFYSCDGYESWRDGQRIHLNGKDGTKLRSNRGDLYVPKGYKLLKLAKVDEDAGDGICCDGCGRSGSPPIRPGNLLDAELAVMTKTSALKLAHDGGAVSINGAMSQGLLDTVIELVTVHGLREKIARELVKRADVCRAKGQSALKIRVKYAMGSPYLTDQGPSAPAIPEQQYGGDNIMGYPGRTQNPQEQEIPIQEMQSGSYDQSGYDIRPEATQAPMDQQTVSDAAASGQKEVFDTAMIGSMLKSVRDDTMIDRYLPDLIKGMNSVGRILFQFYWHGDKFSDRYGNQDMPELEDTLRNTFESIGDTIIFLKQKTIEPYPEEGLRDLDLSDTADM